MCNPTVASDEKTDSFPLNSKIHSSVQVTVIFGWLNPKFAYPEDKPCVPCPEVVSGLQQRSNIWSSPDCWVNKSFSYWKKRQWSWDCLRDFSTLHLGTPCHHYISLEPFSVSEYFCYDLLFLQKTWVGYCWVLRFDFWMPALILADLYHWALPGLELAFSTKVLLL